MIDEPTAIATFHLDLLVTIRHAATDDLPHLEWDAQTWGFRGIFRKTYHEALLGERLMLLADAGGYPIGRLFVQLSAGNLTYADGVTRGYLYSLHVMPPFQGRGVGTRLVMAALGLEVAPWRLSGLGAILVVHAYSMYVYFYLFTRAALARFYGSLLEAAASLGASRARRFVGVTLPLVRPALGEAAVLTFLTALGSFSAPYIFGGSYRVMPTQIVASKQNGDTDLAEVVLKFMSVEKCIHPGRDRLLDLLDPAPACSSPARINNAEALRTSPT